MMSRYIKSKVKPTKDKKLFINKHPLNSQFIMNESLQISSIEDAVGIPLNVVLTSSKRIEKKKKKKNKMI
jgi:hypothetical protein